MTVRGDPRGYYATLGLPLTASADDVRRAFGERAKQLHPDHAGETGDALALQAVLDAYEVLRDPSRRLRYDADSVPMSRDDPHEPAEAHEPDPLARPWSPAGLWQAGRRRKDGMQAPAVIATLLGLCVVILGLAVWAWREHAMLEDYETRVADLTVELERARSAEAEAVARYRAAGVGDLPALPALSAVVPAAGEVVDLFVAELRFATGSDDPGVGPDGALPQAIDGIGTAVATIPADRHWLVLILGQAPRGAVLTGADAAGWQLPLLRLRRVVDRLIQAGLPADRIAMRLSAGFGPDTPGIDPMPTIELRVVCCLR